MKKTCATCKHCIWKKHGGRKVMTCKVFSGKRHVVLCDPPYDEACPEYEEEKHE